MALENNNKLSRLRTMRLPIVIIGVTFATIFLLIATRPDLEPVETPERVWNVDAVEARKLTLQPDLALFGELVAGRRSELRPGVSGTIVKIGDNFHEGGSARKGELLLQIDPFDYEKNLAEQRSMLKESEVRLEMLKRDYQRAQELFAEKNVSEQFLDAAELDVLQQEAVVEQRQIGVQRAARDLRDTKLTAPFDGVVNKVNANLGKEIGGFGNDMVAELIDTSRIEVRFSLTNAQYGRLLENDEPIVGRPARVLWTVGDRTLNYEATIERVGAEIASTTGGIDAFAVIDTGGEQSQLRPGAFVSVNLPDKEYANVMQAPDSALYGKDVLYIVRDDRLVERQVDVVGYSGTQMLFRARREYPIEDGDLIVTTQIREGGAGAKVAVR